MALRKTGESSMTMCSRLLKGLALLAFAGLCLPVLADEAKGAKTPTSQEFLKSVREPFQEPTWWEFSGEVLHQKKDKDKIREALVMELAFNPAEMRAALRLGGSDLYRVNQKNNGGKAPEVKLTLPEKPSKLTLEMAGIQPEDLTFAFIYWDLLYDLNFEDVRGQKCRVLELKHPRTGDKVMSWFSVKYGFPLQVYYYHKGEEKPWRILEFKDFKEYEKDFWFVKTLVIRDPEQNWRTQVTFEEAKKNKLGPADPLPELPSAKPTTKPAVK
jgi:hypothetical protein